MERMKSRRSERERLEARAEDFLRKAPSVPVPERLLEFGAQRVIARASRGGEAKVAAPVFLGAWARTRRILAVAMVSLLLVAAGTSGVYAASYGALPGSTLYGSKIFFERARIALTFSPSADARLEMSFCSRRLEELEAMVQKGEERGLERWEREYLRNLKEAEARLATLPPEEYDELAADFQGRLEDQMRRLESCRHGPCGAYSASVHNVYVECEALRTRMRQRRGEGGGGQAPAPGHSGENQPGMNTVPESGPSGTRTTSVDEGYQGGESGACRRYGHPWED